MTRYDILDEAFISVSNADELWAYGQKWLNDALRELENYGLWGFLKQETTYVSENNVDEVAFSASKFPAAAITDFSKDMVIYRPGFGALRKFPTRKAFNDARGTGATGVPTHFLVDYGVGGESLFLFPKWQTGDAATTLTLTYMGEMTFPTADTDDLETVSGIKPKIQGFLINYVRARLWQHIDDNRQMTEMAKWEQGLARMLAEEGTGVGAAAGVQAQGGV